jgi:hypothetical protein
VTITTSGTDKRIDVSGGSPSSTGSSNLFNVVSESVASFSIQNIGTPQTAGTPFNVTITALDGSGNTATDFNGTVSLSLNSGTLTPTTSNNFVNGVFSGNVTVLSIAGSSGGKILSVDDGASHVGSSNAFTVNPGALDHFFLSTIVTQTAGVDFSVTVTARDANDNDVSHTGVVTLDDNTGTLTSSSLTFTSQTSQTVTDVDITFAQSGVVITGSEGSVSGLSNSFTVDPAGLDHFRSSGIGSFFCDEHQWW